MNMMKHLRLRKLHREWQGYFVSTSSYGTLISTDVHSSLIGSSCRMLSLAHAAEALSNLNTVITFCSCPCVCDKGPLLIAHHSHNLHHKFTSWCILGQ